MKAFTTLTIAAFLLTLASCGGGQPPIHIGSPVGPFMVTVGPTAANVFSFKGATSGAISQISAPGSVSSPSSVVIVSPDTFEHHVYVTDSTSNRLAMFDLDSTSGMLTASGTSLPVGSNPMGIAALNGPTVPTSTIPPAGFLYVVNRGSNNLSVFQIVDRSGRLSEVPGSPFAAPANPQAVTVTAVGSSVSSFATFVYVAGGTLGVAGFHANADGSLTALPALSIPAGTNISWVEARGQFLYASDTANNSILGFKIQSDGSLVSVGPAVPAGTQPGAISASMFSTLLYVVNRGSNNVSGFHVDPVSGVLTPVSGSPFATGVNPVHLSIDGRQHMYVANQGSNSISAFTVDMTSGVLTPVAGSPFAVATSPDWVDTLFIMNVD